MTRDATPEAAEAVALKLRVLSVPVLLRLLGSETSEGTGGLLRFREEPANLLDHLLFAEQDREAMIFLAHALPGREAVWWGCMCVAATRPVDAPDAEREAVEAARAWVWQPQAAGRAERAIATSRACADLPGGWPGLAIAWSRSLGSAEAGYGRGIEGAVQRAARRGDSRHQVATAELEAARMRRFVMSGAAISRGEAGLIEEEAGAPATAAPVLRPTRSVS